MWMFGLFNPVSTIWVLKKISFFFLLSCKKFGEGFFLSSLPLSSRCLDGISLSLSLPTRDTTVPRRSINITRLFSLFSVLVAKTHFRSFVFGSNFSEFSHFFQVFPQIISITLCNPFCWINSSSRCRRIRTILRSLGNFQEKNSV